MKNSKPSKKKRFHQRLNELLRKAESNDWGLVILQAYGGGFVLRGLPEGELIACSVSKDEGEDEALAAIDMLRKVVEYFNINSSRYARRRVLIAEEVGDKYYPQEDEELRGQSYRYVRKKTDLLEYGEQRSQKWERAN